jgi:hypothetical protein
MRKMPQHPIKYITKPLTLQPSSPNIQLKRKETKGDKSENMLLLKTLWFTRNLNY